MVKILPIFVVFSENVNFTNQAKSIVTYTILTHSDAPYYHELEKQIFLQVIQNRCRLRWHGANFFLEFDTIFWYSTWKFFQFNFPKFQGAIWKIFSQEFQNRFYFLTYAV